MVTSEQVINDLTAAQISSDAKQQQIQEAQIEAELAKKAIAKAAEIAKEQKRIVDSFWSTETKSKDISRRVLETLKRGRDVFKAKMFKQYQITLEEFLYELEMAWLAITSKTPVKGLISSYYDPILFDYVKMYANKLKEAIFESDDYFAFKDEKGEISSLSLQHKKEQIKHHIKQSKVKAVWKRAFDDVCKLGTAVTKYLPYTDETSYIVQYTDQFGNVIDDLVRERDQVINAQNINLTDIYISNPYQPDLNKQDFCELRETTFQELKRLESRGVYKNVDDIKSPVSAIDYGIDDSTYEDMRELMNVSEEEIKKLNKKGDKDFKVRLAEFWGGLADDKGNVYKMRITMAGVTVIGIHMQIMVTGGEYVPYEVLRLEHKKDEFYGWGKMHRLLKTQLLHNLLWNLTTDLNIKNLQGNMITSQENKILIQQQLDSGLKPNEVVGVNVPSGMRTDQLIMPIKYPDPNNIQQINEQLLSSKFERGTLSRAQQGLPTGSQIDRSGKAYSLAVGQGDSNIKEDIYTIQDVFLPNSIEQIYFIVAKNAFEKILVGTKTQVDSMGNSMEVPVFESGKDLYGIPRIEIYGGSLYLENEKKLQDLKDLIGMVANSKAAERINWDNILRRYAVLRGYDINEFVNNKSPLEMLQDVFAVGVTPEELQKIINQIVADRREQQLREAEGQDISEKQYQVNKMRVNQALEAARRDKAEEEVNSFDPKQFLVESGMEELLGEDDEEMLEVE